MENTDDRREMRNLRTKVYGGQALEFIEIIEESLLLKGWSIPSIGYDYLKAYMIGQLFKRMSGRFQKSLVKDIDKYMSSKNSSENPQASKPTQDDYSKRLWENGFTSQTTQKHLF